MANKLFNIDLRTRKGLFYALSLLFFASLFYSKFVLSLCLFGFVFLALMEDRWKIAKWNIIKFNLSTNKYLLFLSLVFFGVLISGINSSNMDYWMHHVQLKLPFLVMPLAFATFGFIDEELIIKVLKGFLIITLVSVIHTAIKYFLNMDFYNNLIARGQSMPTPIQHVNYSLILAFATVCSYFLFKDTREKWLLIIGVVFFLFMHLIAVRTGLVALYVSVFIVAIMHTLKHRDYLKSGLVLLACILVPLAAYYAMPSLSSKVDYMLWDMTQFSKGKTADYSDGGRMVSYQLGLDLFKENIWMGTGIGDMYDQCLQWYQTHATDFKGKVNFPHNQFLHSLASTGIIGLILYQAALLVPFFKLQLYKVPYGLILFVIIYTSFLVETSLERNYGIVFFLFFFLLWGVKKNPISNTI